MSFLLSCLSVLKVLSKTQTRTSRQKKIITPLPVSCSTNVKNVELLCNMPSALLSYKSVKSACVPIVTNINWEHRCYQKSFGPEIDKWKKKLIFNDFENLQDEIFQCEQGYNTPSIRCRHCVQMESRCSDCRLCQTKHLPLPKKNNLSFAHKSVGTIGIDDAIFFFIRSVFNVSSV